MLVMNAPGAVLARAADADGGGEVDADEWQALIAALDGADGAPIDPRRAAAFALRTVLDADGDGDFDAADVGARLAALDTDGSGELERGELEASFSGPRGVRGAHLFDGLVAFGLDADGDVRVSPEEWGAAVASPDEPGAHRLSSRATRASSSSGSNSPRTVVPAVPTTQIGRKPAARSSWSCLSSVSIRSRPDESVSISRTWCRPIPRMPAAFLME